MYYDDNAEVGDKYEQFIAAYYANTLCCRVIYHGHILGEADGGIDLIALTPTTTYLIQCKKWSKASELHEKYVNQLYGAAHIFARKYPSAKNIQSVLVATCRFAEDAVFAAEANGVALKNIEFEEKYVNGQLILSNGRIMTQFYALGQRPEHMRPSQDAAAYQQRVREIIDEVQYPKPVVPAVAAPQIPSRPETFEPIFRDFEKQEVHPPKLSFDEKASRFSEKIPSPYDSGMRGCMGYLLWGLFVIIISAILTLSIGFVINLTKSGDNPTQIVTPSPAITAKPTATPKPSTLPENGAYFPHTMSASRIRDSELTITTPSGNYNYCIVLVSAEDPSSKICSIFLHPGRTTTVNVPAKDALIYYISAPSDAAWYDSIRYFGSRGSWTTSDKVFDFSEYTWSIKLQKVTNGNWDTEAVDDWEVPFLN